MKTADAPLKGKVEPGPGVVEIQNFYASLVVPNALRSAITAERERITWEVTEKLKEFEIALNQEHEFGKNSDHAGKAIEVCQWFLAIINQEEGI